jgi:hypothetical protein
MKLKGNNIVVMIEQGGVDTAIAYGTTCELDIQAEVIEISSKQNGIWKRYKKRKVSWTITSAHVASDGYANYIVGLVPSSKKVKVFIGSVTPINEPHAHTDYVADGKFAFKGYALVKRAVVAANRGSSATLSVDFQGSGEAVQDKDADLPDDNDNNTGGGGGSDGDLTLGELLNVGNGADSVPSEDRVLYQEAGSSIWTWKAASEIMPDWKELLREMQEQLDNMYLRKDQNDRTAFDLSVGGKLTAEEYLQVGTTFAGGMAGYGTRFDNAGYGELDSLMLRRELVVPLLVYNRVDIKMGDDWRAPGAGIVKKVIIDYDEDGNALNSGSIVLKLEEGEIGAVAVDDICMGIFHSLDSSKNATEDSDDSLGNRTYAGFFTSYFRITEVSTWTDEDGKTYENGLISFELRPVSDRWKFSHMPEASMTWIAYGNFTNEDRQTSEYQTRTYRRYLKHQNTWEIGPQNIAYQSGDLSNLSVHSLDMTGYSTYQTNAYFTGTIKQILPDGTPVTTANERGAYVRGEFYNYFDRTSYLGNLWLCVAENGTDTVPSRNDAAWLLEVEAGTSVSASGPWDANKVPYPANTILSFADRVWISNKQTSEAPYPIYLTNDEELLQYEDGGYVIVDDTEQSADWDLLLDAQRLVDGASLEVRYSSDKLSWHDTFTEGDLYMQQRVGSDAMWSDAIRIVGEDGQAKDGRYMDYQFAVSGSLTEQPTTGWQDAPPSVGLGQYLWMRCRLVDPNSGTVNAWTVTRIGGEKGDQGDKGDSVTSLGQWYDGLSVPYLGMVQMAGSSYVAKKATKNPPLWTYTDSNGARLKYKDGGYVLTGAVNTDEYDCAAEKGDTGEPGKDGKDGDKGEQGIQGCIVRWAEWTIGTQFRNDTALTSGIRYLDVALVKNDSTATGYDAYQCKKTHVSTIDNSPTKDSSTWEEFGANVTAIFTSLIIAKNAVLKFAQSNQLLIQKDDGTVTAGISGSTSGNKIRFWAGSTTPDSAPFRVDEDGNGTFAGTVTSKTLYLPWTELDLSSNKTYSLSMGGCLTLTGDTGHTLTLPAASTCEGLVLRLNLGFASTRVPAPFYLKDASGQEIFSVDDGKGMSTFEVNKGGGIYEVQAIDGQWIAANTLNPVNS